MLSKLNINKFDDTQYKSEIIKNAALYNEIIQYVKLEAAKKHNYKATKVAEHDAYHLLLIRQLREETELDFLGPHFWFLTLDTSLSYVDEDINREISITDHPSSMMVNLFFKFIMSFLGPEVENEQLHLAFTDLMRTDFSVIPVEIDLKLLSEIVYLWLNYQSLSDEEIEKIISDKNIKEYWEKVKKLRNDPPAQEKAREELSELIEKKTSEVLDEKVIKLNTDLKLEQKFNLIIRSICLILGIILLVLGCWFYNSNGELLATALFFIGGIVLIVISLAYKKIKLSFLKGELEVER